MKELQTSKPLLLGMLGLPGAGKSRFASEFSTMFGAPVIEMERLRRLVFATRPITKDDEEGLKRLYWHLAEEQAKTKRTFILDGNLHTYGARTEARTLAKKAGYDVLWLWVQTSEPIARDRATKLHRGATNTILTPEAFSHAIKAFEAPRSSEDHVVLSGQRTFSSQVRPILARLAQSHEAKLQAPRPVERPPESERPPRRNIFIR